MTSKGEAIPSYDPRCRIPVMLLGVSRISLSERQISTPVPREVKARPVAAKAMVKFIPILKVMTQAAVATCLIRASTVAAQQNEPTSANEASTTETGGVLVIVGGGSLPDSIRDRFLRLAGGNSARLVIIPTASARADRPDTDAFLKCWLSQPVASIRVLHTRDRRRANDPAFVKPLMEATGVWLSGGDQCRLASAYGGTLVERELEHLLARGGVIGGTSAGASIMSSLMIEGGDPVARLGHGFGFLSRVVIDQHFGNRKRLRRLLGVLANNPSYVGVGIDEESAALVRGNILTALGNARVWLCRPTPGDRPADVRVLRSGEHVRLDALNSHKTQGQYAAAKHRFDSVGRSYCRHDSASGPRKSQSKPKIRRALIFARQAGLKPSVHFGSCVSEPRFTGLRLRQRS